MAPEQSQVIAPMGRRGSTTSINLNPPETPETPAIDIHDVSSSVPLKPHRSSLTQPSFRDNEFKYDTHENVRNPLAPNNDFERLGALELSGPVLPHTRPVPGSVSGSEDDRSEGVKTFTTDHHFGLGSLDRPGSRRSNQDTNYAVLQESLSDGAVNPLSGVEGAGGGLLLSGHDPRLQHERAHLEPGQMKSEISIDSIGNQIRHSMEESAVNKEQFLPNDKLDAIVNEHNVRRILETVKPPLSQEQLEATVQKVLYAGEEEPTGMRRIFATFILMDTIDYIFDCIRVGVYDFNLPLSFSWNVDRNKYDLNMFPDNESRRWCDEWRTKDISHFEKQQMAMLAPVLQQPEDKLKHYELTHQTILPFLEHKHKNSGGYGKVFKVKIHPAHCKFLPDSPYTVSNSYFAVKALDVSKRDEFRAEVEILQRFSAINQPHPHLIQLLLTYQHRDNYYLLFPWARCNLKEYWKELPRRPLTPDTFSWFIEQCLGITAGLRKIHRIRSDSTEAESPGMLSPNMHKMNGKNYGRHGDIKPENILCFQKDGDIQLVITDFGLSRYHSNNSKSHSMSVRGFSATYRPPECDLNEYSITQRYDMWTLGCLFLEFASWLVLGNHQTEVVFARARVHDDAPHQINEDKFFYSSGNQTPKVKDSVLKWISKIRDTEDCPHFIDKLLDLIRNHLLVPNSKYRWECGQVRRELLKIQELLNNPPTSTRGPNYAHSTLPANESTPVIALNGDRQEAASTPASPATLTQKESGSTICSSLSPDPNYSNDTTPYDSQLDSSLALTGRDRQGLPMAGNAADEEQMESLLREDQSPILTSETELRRWIDAALGASKATSSPEPPVDAETLASDQGELSFNGGSNIVKPNHDTPPAIGYDSRLGDEMGKDIEGSSNFTPSKNDYFIEPEEWRGRNRWTRRLRDAWLRRSGRIKEQLTKFLNLIPGNRNI